MSRSAPSGLKSGATLARDPSITKEREFCSNLTRSQVASEFKSAVRSTIRNWSTGTAFVRHPTPAVCASWAQEIRGLDPGKDENQPCQGASDEATCRVEAMSAEVHHTSRGRNCNQGCNN